MMRFLTRLVAFSVAAGLLTNATADAQTYPAGTRLRPVQRATLEREAPDVAEKSSPTIYVTDESGILWAIDVARATIRRIGSEDAYLTDIAFNPKDHKLYGVSSNAFYRVSTSSGKATYIGSLGLFDANALTFDTYGKAFTAGFEYPELYSIDITSGAVTAIGKTGSYRSAGDLSFYNGNLVLAGYANSIGDTSDVNLVRLNPETGHVIATAKLNLSNLFGLATIQGNELYGFADTGIYRLRPSERIEYKRRIKLKDFASSGLGQIYGAAYSGDN